MRTSDTTDLRIGFVGAGRMATALAKGFLSSGLTSTANLIASDVVAESRAAFAETTGVETVADNCEVVDRSSVVFLAVKPQMISAVLDGIRERVTAEHLVISIVAGASLNTLSELLSGNGRLVRVMPNTPCLLSAGASAFSPGDTATADDAELVERLLSTVGIAQRVPESLLDAVTGLSGSGPAYVYQMIESLSDGGVRVGLPRDLATRFAAQTVMGAAKMVLETGQHPGVLKDAVASPGGTTIAGLHALERGGLRGCVMDAVEAATKRSQELGRL